MCKKRKTSKDNKQSEKELTYHPNVIISFLVVIAIIAFCLCVLGGIWLSNGICCGLKNCEANPDYFSDFLGGAIGIVLGFIFDKMCIESISHIQHYKSLMRTINHELSNNKKSLAELIIRVPVKQLCPKILSKLNDQKFEDLDEERKAMFYEKKQLGKNEKWEDYIGEDKVYYWSANNIETRIVDDVVKNAETVSTIINVPYASQEVKNKIIDRLGKIYDKLKKFDSDWNLLKQNNREYETILRMLKIRDEINQLIDEYFNQYGSKEKKHE